MLKLNLGCGYKKLEGYENIDNRYECNPDVICDITNGLTDYQTNSVDEIRAFDFLEHIPIGWTIRVVEEIWRVLKPDGVFESFTPSTTGRGAFQDPTHVSFWNINSFLYYTHKEYRDLYGIHANFAVETLQEVCSNDALHIWHVYARLHAIK